MMRPAQLLAFVRSRVRVPWRRTIDADPAADVGGASLPPTLLPDGKRRKHYEDKMLDTYEDKSEEK
jgi:hypothetical protein